jgi:lipopolysaccharide/colanic/teichoic acid biosynthesis glycosyltransferase
VLKSTLLYVVADSSVFVLFTCSRVCFECKENHVTVFRTMAATSNTEAVLVVLCVVIVERLYQQINDVAK